MEKRSSTDPNVVMYFPFYVLRTKSIYKKYHKIVNKNKSIYLNLKRN